MAGMFCFSAPQQPQRDAGGGASVWGRGRGAAGSRGGHYGSRPARSRHHPRPRHTGVRRRHAHCLSHTERRGNL